MVSYYKALDLAIYRAPIQYREFLGDSAEPRMNGKPLCIVEGELELEGLNLRGVTAWSERHPGLKAAKAG